MRLKIFISLFFLVVSVIGQAQDIAVCHSPKGRAYFANLRIVPANKSGWKDDAIDGGRITLTRQEKDLDVLFTDANKRVASSKNSGATVSLMRISADNFTILVYYPNDTIELYSFMRETSGALSAHAIQSTGGVSLVHKSSIMIYKCDLIDFQSLN